MKGYEPRSSSSCAACKFLKRRCIPNCIFAPYFRSDECKKFAKVHKVFGASNVSKILIEVPEEQREDTVNSLAYEAEARLRDPVYGCIGAIALLQRKMVELQHDLAIAKDRLARYATAAATTPSSSTDISSSNVSLPPFPDFFTCSDFNDSFCHSSSSQSLSRHETHGAPIVTFRVTNPTNGPYTLPCHGYPKTDAKTVKVDQFLCRL